MLNTLVKDYDFNPEELKFIENYYELFLKQNKNFLHFELNDKNMEEFLKLKHNKIDIQKEKLEYIDEASELLISYLKNKKRIIFITDNDLDGTSCRALLLSVDLYLKRKFNYKHIYEHYFSVGAGHGISFEHIDNLLKNDINSDALIITADNGINSREQVSLIKDKYKKVKIIITDHHLANEGEDVFDLVDLVLNPESIALNTKSKIKNIVFNNEETLTSYSGGHVLYLYLLNTLKKLNITNKELENELLLIALYSDLGDIINFGADVLNDLALNLNNFKKMYFIKNYINKLDYFNQFPEEHTDYKSMNYISKTITLLNSTRRTNSILLNFNKKEKNEFKDWMLDKFNLNIEEHNVIVDKKKGETQNFYDLLTELNNMSRKILNYFYQNSDNKHLNLNEKEQYNYSYIKEIVPLLLLSNNSLKDDKDTYFIEECYNIVSKMNLIKNNLREYIIEEELYEKKEWDFFEIFFSKKDEILREILSIQAFIESNPKKSFLTIAQTNKNTIKGSMRSKSVGFREYLLDNIEIQNYLNNNGISIEILGHNNAAGIFFTKENIEINDIYKLFDKMNEIALNNKEKLEENILNTFDLNALEKINFNNIIDFIKNNIYIAPNSFIKPYFFNIKGSDLIDKFNNKAIFKTSKNTGTVYMNFIDSNGNTYLYFPKNEENEIDRQKYYTANFDFKYNPKLDSIVAELKLVL